MFSGGGLGDYGLTLAGMEIVGQVEIDSYCQQILKLRWPDVPKWTDVKNVTGKEIIERCGRIDLISGGFPCQPFSVAGTREGENDERHLWPHMHRIICEVKPRWVLAENVPGLLSISDGRVFGAVVSDLAESGYCVEWDCIPASAVGAPHQRDRVWIVGYAEHARRNSTENGQGNREGTHDNAKRQKEFRQSSRSGGARKANVANAKSKQDRRLFQPEFQPNSRAGRKVADTAGLRRRKRNKNAGRCGTGTFTPEEWAGFTNNGWWRVEPDVGRVAHGVTKRVDRLKLLGNGQVVQVVEWIGKRIMAFNQLESVGGLNGKV